MDIRHIFKNDIFVGIVKHVLYLSYDGMTDPLGQSQVLPYIIGLSKVGYSFHLVSFEKPDRYNENRLTIEAICKENNIDWHPLKYTKRPPLLSTVWDVLKMRRVSNKLHKKHGLSLIHCRSYISALIGLSFKRKKGIPFLFDMRGFWADERVDGGLWNLENLLYKWVYNFFKKKELDFFHESDHIVSLTKTGKNEIISWDKMSDLGSKISVIPCCVNTQKFDFNLISEKQKNQLRSELNIDNDSYVMGYVGSIGTWYMLDEMLSFFHRNTKEKNKPIFLFVSREKPSYIFKAAADIGISMESIRVVSSMHHEVPCYMSLFSCSIFFILPAFSKKASSPTKQGELMSMGIPIICNDGVGDTADIVKKFNAGFVVPASEIDTCILNEFNFDRDQAIKGAHTFFGLDSGVNTYIEIYKTISAQ